MNVEPHTMEAALNQRDWETLQFLRIHHPEDYQTILKGIVGQNIFQNNVVVQAESDSHEDARKEQLLRTKSLKRGQSSYKPKIPTESDSNENGIVEKRYRQAHQPLVVEDDGDDIKTTYAIPSGKEYTEGLVLGQESTCKVPQETSYPPSPDLIINENYDKSFEQLTLKSSHKNKINFCITHHKHQDLTETELANLSHIYHAYHCPKLNNYNCTLVQCADPHEIIKVVDHNISQNFVTRQEGNVRREYINDTYKLLVFHAKTCTNRAQCQMPLCKDWNESLNEVLSQPGNDATKQYAVIHSNVPAYAVKDLLNGSNMKTLLSVHIDKGTFGNVSHCLMEDKNGRQFTIAVKSMSIQDQNISRILATSVPILKKFSNAPNILVPDMIATSKEEVLMFMPKADISLMDYLRSYEGGMSPEAVTYYFFQIAKGVKSFHAQDYVHGDIKVANCLLFDNGKTVKICDLDSVKEEKTVQASGSRLYVDPQVLKTRHVKKTSDVYSLCQCLPVLLFGSEEVLTHHPNDLYNMIKTKDVDLAEVYGLGALANTEDRITASIIVSWFRKNVNLCTRRKNFQPKELPSCILPHQKNNLCKHVLKGYFSSVLSDYPKGFEKEV